jgi:hypothetical protein
VRRTARSKTQSSRGRSTRETRANAEGPRGLISEDLPDNDDSYAPGGAAIVARPDFRRAMTYLAISHTPTGTNMIPVMSRSESTGIHERRIAAQMSMKIPATSPGMDGFLFIRIPSDMLPIVTSLRECAGQLPASEP